MKTKRSMGVSRRWAMVAAGAFALLQAGSALAAAVCTPDKPMRFILTTTAGGAADALARALSQQLTPKIGRQIVIDYKPGAGSLIGTTALVNSPPDGCTIGLMTNQYIMLPLLKPGLPFDPVASLTSVAFVGSVPYVWLVRADSPHKTLADLMAYAKANPRKVSFSTGGTGSTSHLLPLSFTRQGIEFYPVPYGGQAQALNAVLAGEVDMVVEPILTGIAHVKSGKLRALVSTGTTRSSLLPDLPTLTEAGQPYRAVSVFAIMTPAGVPPAYIEQLNGQINAALVEEPLKGLLKGMEFSVETGPPSRSNDEIAKELAFWGQVIRDNNVKSD